LQLGDLPLAFSQAAFELNIALFEIFGPLFLAPKLREQSLALDLILAHRMVPRPLLAS
jgi:hypothetical protein